MKMLVNEQCIGCGLCAGVCPEIFQMNEAMLAVASADEVAANLAPSAEVAKEGCPVGAIEEELH